MGDFYFEMESALTEKREKREIEWMKSKRLMMANCAQKDGL